MLDDAEYTGITQMQKGSAGAAWSTDPAWTTLIDDTGTYTYIGEAPPGRPLALPSGVLLGLPMRADQRIGRHPEDSPKFGTTAHPCLTREAIMGFLAKLIAYKVARFGRDTTGRCRQRLICRRSVAQSYGPKDCRGVVAFTAASGAVAGGWAQLTLVADGTNTPSFPAAWKAAYGSQSWTSTAGVVHR